jgi:tetratricopeptide (TPR) repeat protein
MSEATRSRRKRMTGASLGIATIAMATLGTHLARRGSTAKAAIGDQIILADLDNATGDTLFDRSLIYAAATGLQQSARLRVYPRSRLPMMYRLMKLDTPVTLTYELAKEVAERDHVPYVVGLSVLRDGPAYRVVARTADLSRGRDLAEVSASSPIAREVIGTLGDVLVKVRRTLGESRGEMEDRKAPLPTVTTSSLEALRAYGVGSTAWARNDFRRAQENWLKAVDLDTSFALAYSALGSSFYYMHDRANGEKYYAAAAAHQDRLSEWEQLRLRQSRESFRGHSDSSLMLTELMARTYPSATSWYDYGSELMRAGKSTEAIVALRHALEFDSLHVNAWINIATSYGHEYNERIKAYERAGALDTTVLYRSNINHEYGATLLFAGRPADAEKAFRKMADSPRIEDRALGWRSLGYLAFWQGRLYEAIGDFQQAVAATQQMGAPLSEGRNRLLVASAYRAANRMADAEAEVTRTMVLSKAPQFEPTMLALLLYSCEQSDRAKDVESIAGMIKARADTLNPRDRTSLAMATGTVFLVRHQVDSALKYLRLARGFSIPVPRLMLLAAAFDAKKWRDSVRVALEQVAADKGFGSEGQDDFLRVPLMLGDLLLQAGDTAGARRRFQEFATRWKDAPSDTPDLVTARARLAALGGSSK